MSSQKHFFFLDKGAPNRRLRVLLAREREACEGGRGRGGREGVVFDEEHNNTGEGISLVEKPPNPRGELPDRKEGVLH